MNAISEILDSGIRGGSSLLLAALGEMVAELSGVVNLGTEGCMLAGALGGYAGAGAFASPSLGAAGGMAAGMLTAAVFALFVVRGHTDQLATGLVETFAVIGVTSLLGTGYVNQQVPTFSPIRIPVLWHLPYVGVALFDQDPLTYLALLSAGALWWLVGRSLPGLLLRAAGDDPSVLDAFGHSVQSVRWSALAVAGGFSGLAGAQLAIAFTGSWFDDMTAGRGFLAVALVIFGAWRPLRILVGALVFGMALAVSPVLQAHGIAVNQFAVAAVPYILAIASMALMSRRLSQQAPAQLASVFR